jgi:hypothetical protein
VLATLTGCDSLQSFQKYVATLDAVPGVSVDSGHSTPLPFTVHGSVDVTVPADRDVFDEMFATACETPVEASVTLSFTVTEGETAAVQEARLWPCKETVVDLIDLALAAAPAAATVYARPLEGGVRAGLEFDGGFIETVALFRSILGPLAVGDVLTLHSDQVTLDAIATDDAADYLDDFDALAASTEIAAISLSGGALIVESNATDEAAVAALLTARSSDRYDGVEVVVTAPGTGSSLAGADPAVIDLRDWVVEHHESATFAMYSSWLSVSLSDPDDIPAFSEDLARNNPEAVSVTIGSPDGDPQFRVRPPGVAVTGTSNPYPEWFDQYEKVADTGLVQTVEFGDDAIEAWLTDADYDDEAAFAKVKKVLAAIAADAGYDRYGLNNRSFEN